MHTTTAKHFVFHHNGGFDGDVHCQNISTGEQITIPFDDLKMLVAVYVSHEKIRRLEEAEDDEILGLFHTNKTAS